MNNERQLLFVAALVALVGYGCAQSEPIDDLSGNAGASQIPPGFGGAMGAAGEPGTGSGGATAAGGDTGAAGVIGTGTGGKLGTGGTTMTGGTTGAGGGVTETGGSTGAGGRATETGGSTGAGGATETGGSTGAAGSSGRGGGRGGITGAAGAGGGAGTGKGAGPTFTQIYSTILSVYCTGSSCHSPGTAGGLSFASKASAYSSLQNYVTPGDDTQSDFYFAVSTGAMPKGKAKLSAANIATIKGWIDAGALDN
jgi:hypothetical protein